MKVEELIEKLKKCNPDASVSIEIGNYSFSLEESMITDYGPIVGFTVYDLPPSYCVEYDVGRSTTTMDNWLSSKYGFTNYSTTAENQALAFGWNSCHEYFSEMYKQDILFVAQFGTIGFKLWNDLQEFIQKNVPIEYMAFSPTVSEKYTRERFQYLADNAPDIFQYLADNAPDIDALATSTYYLSNMPHVNLEDMCQLTEDVLFNRYEIPNN